MRSTLFALKHPEVGDYPEHSAKQQIAVPSEEEPQAAALYVDQTVPLSPRMIPNTRVMSSDCLSTTALPLMGRQ